MFTLDLHIKTSKIVSPTANAVRLTGREDKALRDAFREFSRQAIVIW